MLTRFRMDVVCATVREAVEHAGGLICDRSLSGWEVGVFAADDGDDIALRILGAARTESLSQEPGAEKLLRAVVVSASRYRDDDDLRCWVEEAMGDPLIEVLVWDSGRPASEISQVEIPISRAAAGFLGHARAAVGCESPSDPSEFFRQLRTGRVRQARQRQNVRTMANGV
jgi:hypothetical protein